MKDEKNMGWRFSVNTQQDNFISACMAGVDPRTGFFTNSTTLFDYTSCFSDVKFSFVINYNSKNRHLNQGYGYGFTDNLTRYNKKEKLLSLSSGQVYTIANDTPNGQPELVDCKYRDFTFFKKLVKDINGVVTQEIYYIKYVNGILEKLENIDLNGDEQDCHVPSAIYYGVFSEVQLYWDYNGGLPQLVRVREIKPGIKLHTDLLSFNYVDKDRVMMRIFKDTEYEYNVYLELNSKSLLTKVKNFGFDVFGDHFWGFKYSNLTGEENLLEEVRYPSGRKDTIKYVRSLGAFNLAIPDGFSLYTVRLYKITPQFMAGIKDIVTTYIFKWNVENNRYLSIENCLDIKRNIIKQITRTYNKFNLLISESMEVGGKLRHTCYAYNDCDENKDLAQQSIKYQCISQIKTTLTDTGGAGVKQREEVVNMEYDEYGNLTKQLNDNNSIIQFVYIDEIVYEHQAIEVPNGLRVIKSYSLVYPGHHESNIRKEYTYELLTEFANNFESIKEVLSYKIVPVEEVLYIGGNLINKGSLTYHNEKKDKMQFSKIKSRTLQCFDRTTTKEFKWDCQQGNLVLRTTTKNAGIYSLEILSWDGITGFLRGIVDSLNRRIEYIRDKLGRVLNVTLTSNINDRIRSKKFRYNYKYNVKEISGVLYYEIEKKDLYENTIFERYDGLGRLRLVAIQKSHRDSEKIIHTCKYNELSQLIHEEHFSYQGNTRFSFINDYSYDDWGNINKVRHDDGVEEHIISDLIKRIKTHWLSDGISIINKRSVTFDENNQPVIYKSYTADGLFSQITFGRDFCGRLINKKDELGRVTQYGYDILDRVSVITLPDKSVIKKSYNMYSEEPLIEKITFTSSVGKTYELGTQTFDDFNRLKESQCYGVITKYRYYLYFPLPDEISFADGSKIFYQNDYGLRDKILSSVDRDNKSHKEFTYSKTDDSLAETKFVTAHDTYIEKISEDFVNSRAEIHTKFTHDNNVIDLIYKQENYFNNDGVCKITDETNNEYIYTHDSHGRLAEISAGEVKTEIQYDKFSRISHVTESDELKKSVIHLKYDEFSREIERRVALSFTRYESEIVIPHSLILAVKTKYYANNLIESRMIEEVKDNGEIIRNEKFIYDILDRVLNYQCEGEILTTDKSGRGLKAIDYTYDRVGNISQTDTTYEDGSHSIIRFYYDENNPFILRGMYNNRTLDYTDYEFNHLGYLLKKKITQPASRTLTKRREVDYKYDNSSNLSSIKDTRYENDNVHISNITEYKYGTSDRVFFKKTITGENKIEEIITSRGFNNEIINIIDFRNKEKYKKIDFLCGEAKQLTVYNQDDTNKKMLTSNRSGTPIYAMNFKNGKYEGSESPGINIYGGSTDKNPHIGLNGDFYDDKAEGYIPGVRLYDPEYMRFTTPDSLSPFNGGNINPYIYCCNNPVNNNDNTGYLTNEHWKIPIYIAGSLSVFSGMVTLGGSLAMSSVMMTVFSLLEIGMGVAGIISVYGDDDDSDLIINGAMSTISFVISAIFNMAGFKYPLSKSLKRFFDFNKNQQNLRTLSFDRKKKEIMGLKYLGQGVSVFNDTYKNKPRLNIYSHGKKASLVEVRLNKSGKSLKVNKLDSVELERLLRITGSIDYDNYASIRIIACHSADFGFLTPALGYGIHQITGLPVKAFQGSVTSFGYPPDVLQSSFEKFAHDPHAMQNIQKQFSSRFEIVHNANYSPKYFF